MGRLEEWIMRSVPAWLCETSHKLSRGIEQEEPLSPNTRFIQYSNRLLAFHGISGLLPYVPSTLQCKDAVKSQLNQLSCHTGTGGLVLSGAVQDVGIVFSVFPGPAGHIGFGIFSDGTFNFGLAGLPTAGGTHIDHHHGGIR